MDVSEAFRLISEDNSSASDERKAALIIFNDFHQLFTRGVEALETLASEAKLGPNRN